MVGIIIAVVIIGSVLALWACCAMAGDCTWQEEQQTAPATELTTDNRCVYCGEIIPEGRQVCPNCERMVEDGK